MTPSSPKSLLFVVLAISLCFVPPALRARSASAGSSTAAGSSSAMVPHGSVALLADVSAIRPDSSFQVAFHFTLEPGWHIYWSNPGDSGEPPRLIWHLPPAIKSGAIEWPAPKRLPAPGVMDFGYTGDVALLVPMHVAALAPGKPAVLDVQLKLIVCRELCIPGGAQLSLRLPVGSSSSAPPIPAQTAAVFAAARNSLPKPAPRDWKVRARRSASEFVLEVATGQAVSQATFFPLEEEQIDNAAPQPVDSTPQGLRLHLKEAENLTRPPAHLRGVIELPAGAYWLDAPVSPAPAVKSPAAKPPVKSPAGRAS